MKTKLHRHLLFALPLLAAANALCADAVSALAPVSSGSSVAVAPAIHKDLGCDIHDGKTNKIARVLNADPLNVYVLYEGGKGGRKISRLELPPQLAATYPYEPDKAAAFLEQQARVNEARQRAYRESLRNSLKQKEQQLLAEIAALDSQNVLDQKERTTLNQITNGGRRGGGGRLVRLEQLQDKRLRLEKRVEELKLQVAQVRAQMDRVP